METIDDIFKGIIGLCVLAVVGIIFCAGCQGSPTYSAPKSFTVSNDAVTKVVQDAIAGDSNATRMDGSPLVNCTGETSCTVAYTVKQPTWGKDEVADLQLVEPTRQIWRALFTDPRFQNGTITVSGPVTNIGGKTETGTYYTLTCDRDAASQIDWNNVKGNGLRTLCNYAAQTKELPGYTGPTPPGD